MQENQIIEILQLRADGLSFRAIGDKLNISANKARYWYEKNHIEDEEDYEVNMAVSKMVESDTNKLNKKILTGKAMAQFIADKVKENMEPIDLESFDIDVKPKNNGTSCEIVVQLSDMHVGKKTVSFSTEIAKQRLIRLLHKVHHLIAMYNSTFYKVDKVHVLLGGDLVDGDNLYPGHANFIDNNVYKQVSIVANMLTEFIMNIKTKVPQVEVSHVYGNHGRVSKFTNPKNNWDIMMYLILEGYLRDVPGVKLNDGYEWYYVVESIAGNILLTHGDGIMMYQNIPLYGMIQKLMRWNTSIGFHNPYKYLMIGHFHLPVSMQWNHQQMFVNGCFTTDDEWVLKGLGFEQNPQQRIYAFTREGLESENIIRL